MRAPFSFTQSLSRNTMRFEGHFHAPPSSLQRNARHSFRKGGGRLPTCSAYISPREPIARPKLSRRRKQCTEQLRCIGLGGLSTINWQHFLSPRCSTLIPDGESCANAFASAWANSGVQCAPTSCRRSLTFEQWPRPFRVRDSQATRSSDSWVSEVPPVSPGRANCVRHQAQRMINGLTLSRNAMFCNLSKLQSGGSPWP